MVQDRDELCGKSRNIFLIKLMLTSSQDLER